MLRAQNLSLARALGRPGGCSGGQLSLQNVLDQAVASLLHVPPYGSREVLLLQSSLSTCDPVRLGGLRHSAHGA